MCRAWLALAAQTQMKSAARTSLYPPKTMTRLVPVTFDVYARLKPCDKGICVLGVSNPRREENGAQDLACASFLCQVAQHGH
eukprot:513812-Amphidinium_carterae.1